MPERSSAFIQWGPQGNLPPCLLLPFLLSFFLSFFLSLFLSFFLPFFLSFFLCAAQSIWDIKEGIQERPFRLSGRIPPPVTNLRPETVRSSLLRSLSRFDRPPSPVRQLSYSPAATRQRLLLTPVALGACCYYACC